MEIASFVIACFAGVISIIVAVIEYKRDYEINQKNLESEYINTIYKNHLIISIPQARRYIKFDREGKIKETDKLCKVMQSIQIDSLYYLYSDKDFYEKLCQQAQLVEDYLIGIYNSGRNYIGEQQTEVFNELQKKIKELYKLINDKYIYK